MFLAEIVAPEEEPVKRIQRTLSSAELKTLVASPVTILGAPGAGNFYAIHSVIASFDFITPAYTLNGNSYLYLPNLSAAWVYFAITGLLNATSDQLYQTYGNASPFPTAAQLNAPLAVTFNGPLELTLGNGTLKLVIFYTIEDQA